MSPSPQPAQAAPDAWCDTNGSDLHDRASKNGLRRARVTIRGAVQGVGFRPYVFRLATELALSGWVSNSTQGVIIELEGLADAVEQCLDRLTTSPPPRCRIHSLETVDLDPAGFEGFEIRPSDPSGERSVLVLPDIATCPDCLREILDPRDRRFGYPFTNCTNCGPRYSIIEAVPYDRANTTMKGFAMCAQCRAEYEDPRDRRFHAQPNACPTCGPHLELWETGGACRAQHAAALGQAAAALRDGAILAVKGLGGFHLMVLAADDAAVRRLRHRKHREEKPLALMVASVRQAAELCRLGPSESRLLRSPEAPIVLLRRQSEASTRGTLAVSPAVAPGNPYLGVMLPYTPLHHLLLAQVGQPVVATSGNRGDEPICYDEAEAPERLGGIADLFLVHNRPIVRHVDDSIIRIVAGREMMVRRARGYAPLPVTLAEEVRPTLAVGGHLKNTVALGCGRQVFLSQHIGDLTSLAALEAFDRVILDLERLYGVTPELVAADAHPDYPSTRKAHKQGVPVLCVQHHCAHVLACMAENDAPAPLLGVSWDGTGLGEDETIWGGEFFHVTEKGLERVAYLRTFRLPGGEKAVQEPRRTALGLLNEIYGDGLYAMKGLAPLMAFSPAELKAVRTMLAKGVNSPLTSSAGRLFDAVASITGLRHLTRFEGQAAMDLEFALDDDDDSDQAYHLRVVERADLAARNGAAAEPCPVHSGCQAISTPRGSFVLDWEPMIEQILEDLGQQVPVWVISAKFHHALADGIRAIAHRVGEQRVVLTGGCFQNKYLLERTVRRLRSDGFNPCWHQRVPPNDGGLALGQIIAAQRARPRAKPRP